MNGHGAPRVLVVGLGIAGICTAIALHRAGWEPVVVERAPERRRGGYSIGLFGTGKAAAGRLGFREHLRDRTPRGADTFEIDRRGRRRPGFGFADQPGDPWVMTRGDLEQAAFAALPADVEVRFSTTPTTIAADDDGVDVDLRDLAAGTSTTERFALVVGADGLRSGVRAAVFGPHEACLHPLGYRIAALEMPADLPGIAQGEGAVLCERGRSVWVLPFADRPSTVLFSYRAPDGPEPTGSTAGLRAAYGPEPLGPVLEAALGALDAGCESVLDDVAQVRLDRWHVGRVVVVGDAAWCATLYSGMGASAAIAGAELLGAVLTRTGPDARLAADTPAELERALDAWEARMRPYVDYYQHVGVRSREVFTPVTWRESLHRFAFTRLRSSAPGRRLLARLDDGSDLRMRNADISAP
jgi:2-polyprenyl-6-methoxyphenol hydroxylase-like FAD-dependent oxidoreductase